MIELIPCPFCGGEAEIQIRKYHPGQYERFVRRRERGFSLNADGPYRAHCAGKACIGVYIGKYYPTKEEAAEAWNRRAET